MATISRIVRFTPHTGDNHKKSDDEKFEVKLKAVSVDKKQGQLLKMVQTKPEKLMEQMMDARQQGEIKSLLKAHLVGFVNFNIADEITKEDVGKDIVLIRNEPAVKITDTHIGEAYERAATVDDIFELGEFELVMEIFMYMIGSSQLKRLDLDKDGKKKDGELPSHGEEKEDEEKNSESLSGTTPLQIVQ